MKINLCRVLICSRDDSPHALDHDHLHLMPRMFAKEYPWEGIDPDCITEYKYHAPESFEGMVGLGVLFENDWCNGNDVYFLCQVWNADRGEWTETP